MPTALAVPALAAALAGALALQLQAAPWNLVAGTALAAGAPLVFILHHTWRGHNLRSHPLLISILSGFGCVVVMTGIQRFGADPAWALLPAIGALVVWMLWQKRGRSGSRPPEAE